MTLYNTKETVFLGPQTARAQRILFKPSSLNFSSVKPGSDTSPKQKNSQVPLYFFFLNGSKVHIYKQKEYRTLCLFLS